MTSNLDHARDQQRETWDRFSVGWRRWDAMVSGWLAPFGEAMIRQVGLRGDSRVLDVATGMGEPGLRAAELVPEGHMVLTDLAPRMLAVAREKAVQRGLRNVETQVCEANALPFADASFDAVLCRFGFMFFPDVNAAAAELRRVARPGARVSAAVWAGPEVNPWATVIIGSIGRNVALPAPSPSAPGLFRLSSEGNMKRVFARAGFSHVTEEEVSCDLTHDSAERYWEFMTEVAAPVVAGLAHADEATQAVIRAEVLDRAREHLFDGRVLLRSTALVVVGTR